MPLYPSPTSKVPVQVSVNIESLALASCGAVSFAGFTLCPLLACTLLLRELQGQEGHPCPQGWTCRAYACQSQPLGQQPRAGRAKGTEPAWRQSVYQSSQGSALPSEQRGGAAAGGQMACLQALCIGKWGHENPPVRVCVPMDIHHAPRHPGARKHETHTQRQLAPLWLAPSLSRQDWEPSSLPH